MTSSINIDPITQFIEIFMRNSESGFDVQAFSKLVEVY